MKSTWYLLASDCQTKGLQVFRSRDAGHSWEGPAPAGYISCSGSAHLVEVAGKVALIYRDDTATSFALQVSEDGLDWSKRPLLSDAGAGDFASKSDGSHVRVICCGVNGAAQIWHAASWHEPDTTVSLPGGAKVAMRSLGSAEGQFVVLSDAGVPYVSSDGTFWAAEVSPFPGCSCSRLRLTVLHGPTWWAQAWDGRRSRYAVTTDGARSWRGVPAPPGSDVAYPNDLVAWNETSAVVERNGASWVTYDLGGRWQQLAP